MVGTEKWCNVRPAFYRCQNTSRDLCSAVAAAEIFLENENAEEDATGMRDLARKALQEKYVMTDEHRDKHEQKLYVIVHPSSLLPLYVKTAVKRLLSVENIFKA